jgi:enoyl-CoA hydratase/carnithine racemase
MATDAGKATDDLVLYGVADGVATLTLNRPDRLNAWTPELEDRYFDQLDRADDDPEVRVIVVTGAGRGFCAGMDSAVLSESAARGSGPRERTRPMSHALTLRKLTVAAINGGCAGIGFVQALCCDVRFAATDAKLATAFTRRGLPPEFAAGLMLSGRAITGAEAEKMGVVSRAVAREELLIFACEYARDVAAHCSPRAIADAKADLLADATRSFAQAELDAQYVYHRPHHADDFREGITSYVEKRAPRFANVERRER